MRNDLTSTFRTASSTSTTTSACKNRVITHTRERLFGKYKICYSISFKHVPLPGCSTRLHLQVVYSKECQTPLSRRRCRAAVFAASHGPAISPPRVLSSCLSSRLLSNHLMSSRRRLARRSAASAGRLRARRGASHPTPHVASSAPPQPFRHP